MEFPIYLLYYNGVTYIPAMLWWSYLYICYTIVELPIYLLYYNGVTYIPAIL